MLIIHIQCYMNTIATGTEFFPSFFPSICGCAKESRPNLGNSRQLGKGNFGEISMDSPDIFQLYSKCFVDVFIQVPAVGFPGSFRYP